MTGKETENPPQRHRDRRDDLQFIGTTTSAFPLGVSVVKNRRNKPNSLDQASPAKLTRSGTTHRAKQSQFARRGRRRGTTGLSPFFGFFRFFRLSPVRLRPDSGRSRASGALRRGCVQNKANFEGLSSWKWQGASEQRPATSLPRLPASRRNALRRHYEHGCAMRNKANCRSPARSNGMGLSRQTKPIPLAACAGNRGAPPSP